MTSNNFKQTYKNDNALIMPDSAFLKNLEQKLSQNIHENEPVVKPISRRFNTKNLSLTAAAAVFVIIGVFAIRSIPQNMTNMINNINPITAEADNSYVIRSFADEDSGGYDDSAEFGINEPFMMYDAIEVAEDESFAIGGGIAAAEAAFDNGNDTAVPEMAAPSAAAPDTARNNFIENYLHLEMRLGEDNYGAFIEIILEDGMNEAVYRTDNPELFAELLKIIAGRGGLTAIYD